MNKIYISEYELKHYASPYYDPVKAHQYYEEHKKLKGGTAGRSLNDKGKEAKLYVSDQIKSAKKASSEKAKADTEKAKADLESATKSLKDAHTVEIDSLQNELLSMSKEELKTKGAFYKRKIAGLRQKNSEAKAKIKEEYSSKIKSIREANKAKQKSLSDTLKSEIEKMMTDNETSQETKKGNKSESSNSAKPMDAATLKRIRTNADIITKDKKKKEEKSK